MLQWIDYGCLIEYLVEMNCSLHNVVQLIYKGTTKTLLAQNGDNLSACMLQGKTYDYNQIECLVSNEL